MKSWSGETWRVRSLSRQNHFWDQQETLYLFGYKLNNEVSIAKFKFILTDWNFGRERKIKFEKDMFQFDWWIFPFLKWNVVVGGGYDNAFAVNVGGGNCEWEMGIVSDKCVEILNGK